MATVEYDGTEWELPDEDIEQLMLFIRLPEHVQEQILRMLDDETSTETDRNGRLEG